VAEVAGVTEDERAALLFDLGFALRRKVERGILRRITSPSALPQDGDVATRIAAEASLPLTRE
jgi:hypothetical protein